LLSRSEGSWWLRTSRFAFSLALLYANIGVQVFLLTQVKHFISAAAVHDVRIAYGDFEEHMYPEEHLWSTVNGKSRGVPGYIQPENFASLNENLKEVICQIPLSQPWFLACILFTWALTCFGEIDNAIRMVRKVILDLPTISSCAESIERENEHELKDADSDGEGKSAGNSRIIVGLTLGMKALLFVSIVTPQLGIAGYLLWLGSRWLLATSSFSDLLLNAVALEFIFLLKDLFYRTIVSDRNKLDIEHTEVGPTALREKAGVTNFFESVLYIPIGAMWVWLYMYHFQQVIPAYNWDVHEICSVWVAERYEV